MCVKAVCVKAVCVKAVCINKVPIDKARKTHKARQESPRTPRINWPYNTHSLSLLSASFTIAIIMEYHFLLQRMYKYLAEKDEHTWRQFRTAVNNFYEVLSRQLDFGEIVTLQTLSSSFLLDSL